MPADVLSTYSGIKFSVIQGFTTFMTFLPTIIGAVLILAVGWFLSSVIARVIEKVLFAIGFERVAAKSGVDNYLSRAGSEWNVTHVLATLAKWFLRLIFIQAAANILHMPQITAVINEIILFIPNIAVAVLILLIGTWAANLISGLVQGSSLVTATGNAVLMGTITRYAVIGFSVIAALSQLHIAPVVVNTIFIGFVAAIVIAVGLAFGLGGRDVASEITQSLYRKGVKGGNVRSIEERSVPKTGSIK